MVMALALMPTTFQRTLMPRSTLDQALTTGICGALDYGFAALIQDTVEAVALRISGATHRTITPHLPTSPSRAPLGSPNPPPPPPPS